MKTSLLKLALSQEVNHKVAISNIKGSFFLMLSGY